MMRDVPIKRKLSDTFRSPIYTKATEGQEGGKSLIIRSIFSAYKKAAQAQMKEEYPELMNDIIISKQKKATALTGR